MGTHKYRVYDKTNKKMFYFDQLKIKSGNGYIYDSIFSLKAANNYCPQESPDFSELMQLVTKDNENKECFVNDIVKNKLSGHMGIVTYDYSFCSFMVSSKEGTLICSMGAMKSDGFKILGNYLENPELLEAK